MSDRVWGLLAEFREPEALVTAADAARQQGFTKMDAYTPFPVEGLKNGLGLKRTRLPMIVLLGGIAGGAGGFFLQYWVSVIAWPLNVGGRPLNSWPSFMPVTFELTVLVAAFSAVIGMLACNGLPQPYHPVFNVPQFKLASRDRFFLSIESKDSRFDLSKTKAFLKGLKPVGVYEVEP